MECPLTKHKKRLHFEVKKKRKKKGYPVAFLYSCIDRGGEENSEFFLLFNIFFRLSGADFAGYDLIW